MPHEKTYLDKDPIARREAELLAKWEAEAKIFNVQNEAIRTVLAECPFEIRTAQDCQFCGNEACIKAWKEQNKLWKVTDQESLSETEAACLADTQRSAGHVARCKQHAQSRSAAESKSSDRPGDPACGSSLFDWEAA
jgi:hypothetical protein